MNRLPPPSSSWPLPRPPAPPPSRRCAHVRACTGDRTDCRRPRGRARSRIGTEVGLELGRDYEGTTTVDLVASRAAFNALQPPGEPVPEWVSGTFDSFRHLIVLQVDPNEPASRRSGARTRRSRRPNSPRAVSPGGFCAASRPNDPRRRLFGPSIKAAGRADGLLSLDQIAGAFPARPSEAALAWAESADFIEYLSGQAGDGALMDVLRRTIQGALVRRCDDARVRPVSDGWRMAGVDPR